MPRYWSDGSDIVRGKTAEKLNQERRNLKCAADAPPPADDAAEDPTPPEKAPSSMWGTRVKAVLRVKDTPRAGVEDFM